MTINGFSLWHEIGAQAFVAGPLRTSAVAVETGSSVAVGQRAAGSVHPVHAPPRLDLSTDRLDLGDGKPKETLRGELTLTNRGSERSRFSLIKHCGCTELSPLSGELDPGASQTVRVGVELADHANSERNTSIEVQAGEPRATLARCVVTARCPAPFSVTPAFVGFGSLSAERLAEASREVRIDSVDAQPALDPDNLVIEHNNEVFDVDVATAQRASTEAGSAVTLRVKAKPDLAVGDHWDNLTLHLVGSEYSVRVALNVTVTEPITVVPRAVSLRRDRNARGFKAVQLLVIDHRRKTSLGLVSLVGGPAGLAVEDLGNVAPGRRRLRLSAPASTDVWPQESEVWLSADGQTFAFKVRKP